MMNRNDRRNDDRRNDKRSDTRGHGGQGSHGGRDSGAYGNNRRSGGHGYGAGYAGAGAGDRHDKRARFMKRSRETVMDALRSRDMLLGGVTKTMDDVDQIINLLGERLEDWYGIYFPELKTDDKLKYSEAVLAIDRDSLDQKELAALFGQKKADELVTAAKTSLGAKLSSNDLSQCHTLARSILALAKLRTDYEAYQKTLADELCPNLAKVGGSDVAAKLVSHVGSLRRLALLPASTIQVLGAEKALFKHLKNKRIAPPKHGIIFQHPCISASPKAVRGKVARALANKLCLAAKADAFTKRPLGDGLKQEFDERYAEIMKAYEAEKAKMATAKTGPTS